MKKLISELRVNHIQIIRKKGFFIRLLHLDLFRVALLVEQFSLQTMHLLSILRVLVNFTSFSLSPIGQNKGRKGEGGKSSVNGKLPWSQKPANSIYILALSVIQTSSMTFDMFFDILVLRLLRDSG